MRNSVVRLAPCGRLQVLPSLGREFSGRVSWTMTQASSDLGLTLHLRKRAEKVNPPPTASFVSQRQRMSRVWLILFKPRLQKVFRTGTDFDALGRNRGDRRHNLGS